MRTLESQRTADTFSNQSGDKAKVRIRTLFFALRPAFLQRKRLSQHQSWPSRELQGAHLRPPSSPLELVEAGGGAALPSPLTAVSPTEMYQFSIQESAPIGTAVGRVKAEDSDVGENTDMTYHLREESGSGGHVFKVITDSDTQEAIIVVQKVRLPRK